ncbi:MAG: hypothetical protein Q7J44_17860 [Pseudotabrizicola sp.]|uniref:hypothetical protein n=1 Tax=Pseudotabrizicola sp. TaxID=2939647 RepID=UPI0027244EB5|nr:hypothetical protein [Pseudotabrizicola sp.]MDO9640403.1 hypothetical protein [Pseudotabrizicola sp.]
MTMFPCCAYDPGLAAYITAISDSEQPHAVGDERTDRIICAVAIAAIGLCYGLLFMVT